MAGSFLCWNEALQLSRQPLGARGGGVRCLLRCCGPPLGRQKDQALVVFGVADRLLKVRIRKADVAADAFSSPRIIAS